MNGLIEDAIMGASDARDAYVRAWLATSRRYATMDRFIWDAMRRVVWDIYVRAQYSDEPRAEYQRNAAQGALDALTGLQTNTMGISYRPPCIA